MYQIGDSGIRPFQEWLNRKFSAYSNITLDDRYGLDEARVVAEAMRRYGLPPSFKTIILSGQATQVEGGIATDEFLHRAGWRPPNKPVIFTVEGHLSSRWVGPCAFTAQELERQGVVKWQPVGYDNTSLPFKSQTGVTELLRLLDSTTLPDGYPFPQGTPWGMCIFSQGGIVGSKAFLQMRAQNHPRLKDLKRVVAFGNPYREKNVIAPWVPDPPKRNTQGISDVRMTDTPDFWAEHSRTGDLYAENPDDEVGLARSAIYKIAAESSWSGGPASLTARIVDLIRDPFDGMYDITRAIVGGAMFLGRMGSHGTYDLGPCIEHMRGVA